MIKLFSTILLISLLFSCSNTDIPEEIELGKDARQIVVDFCSCLKAGESQMTCVKSLQKRFKKELLSLHDEDRKKYLKDVAHAVIESKCLGDQYKEANIRTVLESLVNE